MIKLDDLQPNTTIRGILPDVLVTVINVQSFGSEAIELTYNEILYSLNKPDDFILAIVEFLGEESHQVHYVRQPFQREPDFGVTSVNYDFAELLARAEAPG